MPPRRPARRAPAPPEQATPAPAASRAPTHALGDPDTRVYVGDCREILPALPEIRERALDLVFADPPFNWKRAYDRWDDDMPEAEYLGFTYDWLDVCVRGLKPGGALWVNIPDDWAAEIVCYLKGRFAERRPPAMLSMVNWCVWHYRFGQNRTERFINSKVHALYFTKTGAPATWNPGPILEQSDRFSIYSDPRTLRKEDGMPAGKRVPMDVWYGQYWGRIQGNNKERRGYHDNQLPEAYLERVILACSNEGGLVLDPFLGSGTTGVVARAYGRRFIGTEFSPENAASSFERIKAGMVRKGAALGQSSAIFSPRTDAPTPRVRDRFSADGSTAKNGTLFEPKPGPRELRASAPRAEEHMVKARRARARRTS